MTAPGAEQSAWQRQACSVLSSLLDRAYRQNLPALSWTVSHAGCALAGRSLARPHPARREAVTAWAQALGITLRDHPSGGTTRITGTAQHLETPRGRCTVTLLADICDEEEGGTPGSPAATPG